MKNHYLLTLASTAMLAATALPATAQSALMPIPGVRIQQQVTNSTPVQRQTPMDKARQDRARLAKAQSRINMVSPEEMKAMAQARQAQSDEAAPTKKMKVLTSIDRYTPGDGKTVNRPFRYDAFGRALDSYPSFIGSHYTCQYTYPDDTSGKWTEKQEWTEPADGSPAYLTSKDCRTLGADGLVTDREVWFNSTDALTGERTPYLAYQYHFEPLKSDPTQAILTRDCRKNESGLVWQSHVCIWFDYLQSYVYVNNNSGRVELTQQDNVLTATQYTIGKDGQEQMLGVGHYYYDTDPVTHQVYMTGQLTTDYQDGAPANSDGVLYEMQYNTPEAGFYTFIQKQWVDGEWVPKYKYECNYNYLNDDFVYEPYAMNWELRGYEMKNGQYELYVTQTQQWLKHNILSQNIVWTSGNTSLTQHYYTDEGMRIGSQAWVLDDGYIIVASDDTYTYCNYYDNDDRLLLELRNKRIGEGNLIGDDDIVGKATAQGMWYEVKEGDEWTPAAGKTLDMYQYPNLQHWTFDDKGRLATADEYADKDTRQVSCTYTYYDTHPADGIDNGYEELLCWYSYYGPTVEMVYKEQSQYYVNEAGNSVRAVKTWKQGNILSDGTQTVVNPKGRTDTYKYNRSKWVWASAQSDDLVTDEVADGLNRHTVVKNTIDNVEGGGVYPQTKTVTITSPTDASMQGTETYHMADGQWVGDSKKDTWVVRQPKFAYTTPSAKGLAEEYFSYVDMRTLGSTTQPYVNRDCSRTYQWKDGQWQLAKSTVFQYTLDGNTFSWTNTFDGTAVGEELSTNSYTYVRDDEGRLLDMTSELSVIVDGETSYHRINSDVYTYNADGLVDTNEYNSQLVSNGKPSTSHYIDTYHYADIDVVDGIDTPHTAAAQPFSVSGRTISAKDAHTTLTLYNAQGQQVAASAGGTLAAPAPGLYIVSDGSARAKVLVK